MRTVLTIYPVRRVRVARVRRSSGAESFGKMFGKLNSARQRLGRWRRP